MEYKIEDRQLYFVLPGQMHRLTFDEKPQGRIVSFTEEFLISNAIPEYLVNDIYLFDDYGQSPPLPVNEGSLEVYQNLFNQIELFSSSLEKYTLEAVGALVKLLLIQCNNHCSLHKTDNPQFLETTNHLLRNFKQLLNRHFVEWHMVTDYADKLAVTPDYLNKTVKSITGKSAKEHIQSKLIVEAKRSLLFSGLTSKELAYALGFDESAHFNNFFKKNTGLTPTEFKTSLIQS
ncbi:HTH-type transcriptional activator RhaS [bioreactor metagenome]|uniref:HTH-type transcriptional activator RhaS n=1 Tax=bioreactor metagenome TaxID=1076179 RepID=A0A645CWR0_9ZZZZ